MLGGDLELGGIEDAQQLHHRKTLLIGRQHEDEVFALADQVQKTALLRRGGQERTHPTRVVGQYGEKFPFCIVFERSHVYSVIL